MATKYGTQGTVVRFEATLNDGLYGNTVPSVLSLTDNPQAAPDIDVTTLDSTAREFRGGLGDFGTMSGTVLHDPTDTVHQSINTDFLASNVKGWLIDMPGGTTGYFSFDGYVSLWGMPGNIGVDTALQTSMTIRKSGVVTFTAGAAP